MRNILSWKIMHKIWRRSYSQTLLWKIKIEHISGSTIWIVIKFVFIICPSRGLLKYIKTEVLTTYFYLIKSFSKMKKWSGTGAPTPFYAFLMLYFTNWPKSIAWLSLLLEILGNMCCNYLLSNLWRHKFGN